MLGLLFRDKVRIERYMSGETSTLMAAGSGKITFTAGGVISVKVKSIQLYCIAGLSVAMLLSLIATDKCLRDGFHNQYDFNHYTTQVTCIYRQ